MTTNKQPAQLTMLAKIANGINNCTTLEQLDTQRATILMLQNLFSQAAKLEQKKRAELQEVQS